MSSLEVHVMPLKNRRRPDVTLTCLRPGCGTIFSPYRGRESGPTAQRYCSLSCSRAAGVYARRGAWPDLPDLQTTPQSHPAPAPIIPIKEWSPPPFDQERVGAEWREAGARYEAQTAKALQREERHGAGRTLILAGYGARLSVARGALVAQEGHSHTGDGASRHVLYPAVHTVERIICVDSVGSLTFQAVNWCHDQGIMVTMLDSYGNLIATLAPEALTDAKLRRTQYLAERTGQDVVIARELLRRKLAGQRATIAAHPELPDGLRAAEALDMALSWLALPHATPYLSTLDGLRTYEGRCARANFGAWVGLPVTWAKGDRKRVPPHWLSVRERTSPLAPNSNGRHAVDPANAILNYAYAVLESQTRQALASRGFDLACGFLHSDKPGRDSLVYDVMECERGTVDGLVLDFLGRTTFHSGDFMRVTDGSCRIHPQLVRAVVAACRVSQDRLDEHVRWLRSTLLTPVPNP
jgi:CRISPR-associated endonuclease Cas1